MSKTGKVIGIDEVGTGALAGPAYVCAVAVDDSWLLSGLRDSKELTKAKIAAMYHTLVEEQKIHHVISLVTVQAINDDGIGESLPKAWLDAGNRLLEVYPGSPVFLDGSRLPKGCGEEWMAITNADAHIPCVMAAAIIAKFLRDEFMVEQAQTYPHYGWETNVGYGSQAHMEAMNSHGVTPLHRTSFRPVQKFMGDNKHRKYGVQPVTASLYEAWTKPT